MTSLSVTDAAFAGFRLLRDRPLVVLAWAGYFLLATVLMGLLTKVLIMVTGAGPAFTNLEAVRATSDNAFEVLGAILQIGPLAVLFVALNLAFTGIVFSAAYRAWLRPEIRTVGAFHVGGDEARMIGLLLLSFLVWAAYSCIVFFAASLILVMASRLGPGLSALVDLVVIIGFIPAFIYPWVRLSLAGPMTLDSGRVVFFESWGLTHGHFWRLLGAYLLTFVMLVVTGLAAFIVVLILLAIVLVGTGVNLMNLQQAGGGPLGVGFGIYLVFQSLLSAVLLAIFVAPTAEAYRELRQPPPAAEA
jgi:hypothetical protein